MNREKLTRPADYTDQILTICKEKFPTIDWTPGLITKIIIVFHEQLYNSIVENRYLSPDIITPKGNFHYKIFTNKYSRYGELESGWIIENICSLPKNLILVINEFELST